MSEETPTLDYKTPDVKQRRRRRYPLWEIALAAISLLPATYFACYGVALCLPWGWTTWVHNQYTIAPPANSGPTATSINWFAETPGHGDKIRFDTITISVDRAFRWIRVDLASNTAKYEQAVVRPATPRPTPLAFTTTTTDPMPWDQTCVANFLAKSGYDPSAAATLAIADTIVADIAKIRAGQYPPDTGEHWYGALPSRQHRMNTLPWELQWLVKVDFHLKWFTPISLIMWLVLLFVAARWLIRRHRKRETAHWQQAAPAPPVSS